MRPGLSPRQRKRQKWLGNVLRRRLGGVEELVGDVLLTRIKSNRPRFRLERYLDNGKKALGLLAKSPKGLPRHWSLVFIGPEDAALELRFPTRNQAIQAFALMEPVREEEKDGTESDEKRPVFG